MLHERRYWEESDSGACNGMPKYNIITCSALNAEITLLTSRCIIGCSTVTRCCIPAELGEHPTILMGFGSVRLKWQPDFFGSGINFALAVENKALWIVTGYS
jgi:hypothetical protein